MELLFKAVADAEGADAVRIPDSPHFVAPTSGIPGGAWPDRLPRPVSWHPAPARCGLPVTAQGPGSSALLDRRDARSDHGLAARILEIAQRRRPVPDDYRAAGHSRREARSLPQGPGYRPLL